MNWLITIAVVIILIVAGLFFFLFMPKPIVFFDPYTNTTKLFIQEHDDLKKEILELDTKTSVIPIYGLSTVRTDKYPKLYQLLRAMPCVRYAGIINIKPKFEQIREYGYDYAANHTTRYFYTIKASATNKSGIWIDGEKRFFVEKEWVVGDMSREHALFNKSKDSYTTVIFIDIDRHEKIHQGRSPNSDIDKDEVLKIFEFGYNKKEITLTQTDKEIVDNNVKKNTTNDDRGIISTIISTINNKLEAGDKADDKADDVVDDKAGDNADNNADDKAGDNAGDVVDDKAGDEASGETTT